MLKAVIFDFDDTLVHSFEACLKDIKEVAQGMGLEMPNTDIIQKNWGKDWKGLLTALWPGIDPDDFERMHSRLIPELKGHLPIRGVHEIIDVLGKDYIIGIVTGGSKAHFMRKAVASKIDITRFSFILTADEIPYPKSDPRFFDIAYRELQKAGIRKDEVLFVGDSVHDFGIARNAGIKFAGVLTGPAGAEDLVKAGLNKNMIIPSIMELPFLIRNNGF